MIRVADYILKRIQEEGVNHVFYVPGGQCVYLMDALRRNTLLTGISVHHEQAAAMAALSYGLYTNNLGACIVSTGCAGTNTVTGVLHAWQDSIPCIFISGQQNRAQTLTSTNLSLRQIGVQEADIVTIVSSITKYSTMIMEANDIAEELDKAVFYATHGRKGPVWLDVPLDIQNAMIDETSLKRFIGENVDYSADKFEIEKTIKLIENAERPVIIAGAGVRSAGAIDELKRFAEKWHIPIVFTRYSVDILPYEYKYNYGVVCSVGASRYANFIVQNADLVIDLGCRLSIDTTGPEQKMFARNAKVVMVDIDKNELQKDGVDITYSICADVKEFLQEVNIFSEKKCFDSWVERCSHWKKVFDNDWTEAKKQKLINSKFFNERLGEMLPEGTVVLSDAGMAGASVASTLHMKKGSRNLHAYAQGEMGYTLPGAFGAICASGCKTVAISGDGSIMMNLQELQTLVRNQFDIKVVIINNNGYSGVRHGQKAHFRGKSIGTDPSNGIDFPNFEKVAEAFGIPYLKIEETSQIDDKCKMLADSEGPLLCEVICDPDQVDLHNALVKYKKDGKWVFGFRPIEDQSPFVDREVFFKEMIVEPLETSFGEPV